jgi:hypothetical protein
MTIDFIICGLEHSGTTVVSDIFRQHVGCDSGWECGVLLCDSHREFENFDPFSKNILKGWGVSKQQLKDACLSDTISGFYDLLYKSSSIKGISDAYIRFDKTPRYISNLREIHENINIPVIAVTKDLRSIVASDFKRSRLNQDQFDEWYKKYLPSKKRYLKSVYQGYQYAENNPNCELIRLEDLCFDSKKTIKRMFQKVGLTAKIEYFIFENSRTIHTRGTSLNQKSGLGLMQLSKPKRDQIKADFGEFTLMFYDFDL